MSVKAKYIKDLPLKNELDGSESLLVQDSNGTKQAPLGTIVDEIEKWLILNYDYSNQGVAGNYDKGRVNLNQPLDTVKQLITDAKNNKLWVSFMAHTLSGQEANITEANLREWLQHCKDIGVDVVTYAHVFDNYSSTKLENLLATI